MQLFPATEYQQNATELFEKYKSEILSLTPNAIVEHIGSSAIPHAISKGDLDIYIEVTAQQFSRTIEQLKTLGFKEKLNTLRTDELCMLESQASDEDVAFQIVVTGSKFTNFLIFRDRLRNSAQLVHQYNELKQNCMGLSPDEYQQIKAEFIDRVLSTNL